MKVRISYEMDEVSMCEEFESAPNWLDSPDDVEEYLANRIKSVISMSKEELK